MMSRPEISEPKISNSGSVSPIEHSLMLEQSAVFGMEPRSRWLLDFAVWGLTHRRVQAMRWYNRLFLPLGLRVQRRLACAPGLIDLAEVGELLLVCRRGDRRAFVSGVTP